MAHPLVSLTEATTALHALQPLLPAEAYAVRMWEGGSGWQVEVRGTVSQGMDRSAARLRLTRAPDRDRVEDGYRLVVWTGRFGRVLVVLVSTSHVVTRSGGPATLLETR